MDSVSLSATERGWRVGFAAGLLVSVDSINFRRGALVRH